jgi:hypothetical protein
MPLPDNFNEFEHLQDLIRLEHNKAVRAYFKNQADDDISTPKASLKHACLIKDEDTASMTQIRLWLFEFIVKNSQNYEETEKEVVVKSRVYKPQIKIHFLESLQDVEHGYERLSGWTSFRLMSESQESLTNNDLLRYANAIKSEFAHGNTRFIWKKGKEMYCYADWDKGYQMQLLCRNTSDAKQIITKVLSIQNHTPDWKNLYIEQSAEPSEAYPTIPGTTTILGKTIKKARKRPICEVKYTYSTIKIPGLKNLIILHDTTGTKSKALIKN